MLRKRLFFNLAPLVLVLLACGIIAVWSLQRLLDGLDHATTAEQVGVVARNFRWVVLGLAGAFLIVLNLSVLVLLRVAGLVLRPVGKLVDATHLLTQEQYDARVVVDAT